MPSVGAPVPPALNIPWGTTPDGQNVMLTPAALGLLQQLFAAVGGASGGPVLGPATTTIGDFATWANATGTLLADAGSPASVILSNITAQLVAGTNITITPSGGTLIIAASGGGGTGNVTGPSSAINGGFALFDGTTGKLLKSGVVGPGNLAYLNTITTSYITNFNTSVDTEVQNYLQAGTNITLTPSGSHLIISSASSTPVDYWGAYENGVRVGNSASTNSTNLNALISAINSAGGGLIWFNEPGTYSFSSTINLQSLVSFEATGCVFAWAGSTSGTIFSSSSTDVMWGVTWRGVKINEGSGFTGTALNLHSHMYCDFEALGVGTSTAGTFFSSNSDSTAGEHSWGPDNSNRNTAFNRYSFKHQGSCLNFMLTAGIPSGYGGQPQVCTLNTYDECQGSNVYNLGFRFEAWADSNTMTGNCYAAIWGSGGVGFIINQANAGTPSVYNMHIQHLQIDTFGTGLGRYGAVLNNSKQIVCDMFYNDPQAENGAFTGTNGLSYLWTMEDPGTNNLKTHYKGWTSVTP